MIMTFSVYNRLFGFLFGQGFDVKSGSWDYDVFSKAEVRRKISQIALSSIFTILELWSFTDCILFAEPNCSKSSRIKRISNKVIAYLFHKSQNSRDLVKLISLTKKRPFL